MRISENINNRMRDIIRRDKSSVSPEFLKVVTGDLDRLLNDYFDLKNESIVKVDLGDDGAYSIEISASAKRVKEFASTASLRRNLF